MHNKKRYGFGDDDIATKGVNTVFVTDSEKTFIINSVYYEYVPILQKDLKKKTNLQTELQTTNTILVMDEQ